MYFSKVEPAEIDGLHAARFHIYKVVSNVHTIDLDSDSKKNIISVCSFHKCSNHILIPLKLQKRLSQTNAVKYSRISNHFCSRECRDTHFKLISESEFFHLDTTKDHKLSMCLNNLDLNKLNKLKKEPIIARNKTEMWANLLKRKILYLEELTGKNYMLCTDVNQFLAKELRGRLKVKYKNTRICSRRVMIKTVQLFPNEFRIQKNEKGILFIKLITRTI